MKKFWNKVKMGLSIAAMAVLALVALVGFTMLFESMESNHKEQAYAQGQHDVLNGTIKYTELIASPTDETGTERKTAYAEGLEDASAGDIRVKAVTDSTYVWTVSPWGKDKEVPTDTIKVKL